MKKYFSLKPKHLISTILLLSLVSQPLTFITLISAATLQSQAWTTVSVSPSNFTGPPGWISIGATFTISLTVTNATDLYYWHAGLTYNPTVLEPVNLTGGPFLKTAGETVWQPGTVKGGQGLITPHGATLTGVSGASGDGTLASVAFKVKDTGASTLLLEDVLLLDSGGRKIAVALQSGLFELPSSASKPPNAFFDFHPLTPYVNQTVTFNASSSRSFGATIQSFQWDFDDGSQGTGMTVNHAYINSGVYNVTLTVTDSLSRVDTFAQLVTVFPLLPGVSVDAFTQRDGRGPNQQSDAFAPNEWVVLSAFVTRNGASQALKIVTFRVYYPNGTQAWSRVTETDEFGLAYVVYNVPSTPVFGLYSVNATSTISGETAYDTVPFRVGWLVEISGAVASDSSGVPKSEFRKGETLYLKVQLQNIRFYPTSVTLTVAVRDALNQLIISNTSQYVISPGLTTILLNLGSIPTWAEVGSATAYIAAFQWLNGPPYNPGASAPFMVVFAFPDVAIVNVTTSSSEVYVGDSVTVTVYVLNDHFEPHSFDVVAYANSMVIHFWNISTLSPYTQVSFSFLWDTYPVSPGDYTISAQASIIPGETDTADNTYVDGVVRILPRAGPVHDLMVIRVDPSKSVVGQGFSMFFNVTVQNQGDFTETFDLMVYANGTIIASFLSLVLTSGASTTRTLLWDTTGFVLGTYVIRGSVTIVAGETDRADNIATANVILAIPCDIAGSTTSRTVPPDGRVDYKDVFWLLKAYGSDPSRPNWNPNLDFAGSTTTPPAPPDNRVDYVDVFWFLKNFGRTSP